ncbi:Alpha/beta-hydrolase [Favolaschia claudopus]|uniref:Alpha/beta-hydrolase n=1 Tax=Favolaschia claudopus TaxID=2862362 RepID=A0AAV9ZDD8_9AGAR
MQYKPRVEQYGLWPSPVTPDTVSSQVVTYEDLTIDTTNESVYHVERRPVEGRNVLVETYRKKDCIQTGSVVHAYGGAPVVARNNVVFFTNVPDFRIYKIEKEHLTGITPNKPQFRFANLTIHPTRPNLMVAIREDYTNPDPAHVVDTVVSVNTDTGVSTVLSRGWDFYANPVFNPRGTKLAWLRWNHPDMPFRSTQLVVGDVQISTENELSITDETVIAGDPGVSIAQQALWVNDTELTFLHDISGFIQPWIHCVGGETRPILKQPILADLAEPMWSLGMSSYAVLNTDHLLCTITKSGFASLIVLCISSGTFEEVPSPYVDLKYMKRVRANQVVLVASQIDCGEQIIRMTLENNNPIFHVLASFSKIPVRDGFAPRPEPLVLGDSMGRDIHALFFPPTHPQFAGPQDEKPPCILRFHSGPTSRTSPAFSWDRVLYTSRGWAWLDVMYSGSSGYGRQYMERLDGQGGELDVQDCVEATRQTAAKGLIDGNRVVLTGAGGPSVLMSAINFPDFYAAACSQFSVCDIAELYHKSPKLQLFYSSLLLGGTPEEVPQVYRARSPLFHARKIRSPILLAHGAQDPVIPVWQTDAIAREIKESGGQVEYLRFEDEGHGVRRAENLRLLQERQLAFFESTFGFRSPSKAL